MFRGRTRHKDSGGNGVSGGNGAGGRRVWLHELVEAITTALIAATRPIQEQHMPAVQTFTPAKTASQASDQPQRDLMPDSEGDPQPGTPSYPAEPAPWVFADPSNRLIRPRTVLIELPANGGATDDESMTLHDLDLSSVNQKSGIKQSGINTVEVPTAALMQSNALVIDEATIELECLFDRFATEADGRQPGAPRLGVWLDRTGSGSPARIVIKFKRVDRPEGASRIEDALLRNLQ
jgi:hypothetical protein